MSLQHVLLGMLSKGPRSGYELNKAMKTVLTYFWEADHSRIYRTLGSLVEKEWVAYETVVQEQSPNKKIYALTDAGHDALLQWLREPGKRMNERNRNPFLVQMHFSQAITAADQLAVLQAHLTRMEAALATLEAESLANGMPVPFPENVFAEGRRRDELTLDYGIQRYRFEVAWAKHAITMVEAAASL